MTNHLPKNITKNIQHIICCIFFGLYITNACSQNTASPYTVDKIFDYVYTHDYDSAKILLDRISVKDVERTYTNTRSSSFAGKKPPGLLALLFIPFIALDAITSKTTTQRETLLEYALAQSDLSPKKIDFIEYLLNRGANPNKKYSELSPIAIATSKRTDNDIVKLLYRYGANPNAGFSDNTALNIALQQNNKEIILFFIQNNIVFPQNYVGTEIMASAIASGDVEMLDMMITSKITFSSTRLINDAANIIKKKDKKIADSVFVIMVKKLVANKFNADSADYHYENLPIHYAIENKSYGLTAALIPYTKNLNQQNSKGETPLMVAVRQAEYKTVDKLVESGVDLDITNKQGETARDMAMGFKQYYMADAMETHSSEIKERNYLFSRLLYNDSMAISIKKDSVEQLLKNGITLDACRMRAYNYHGPCNYLNYTIYSNQYQIAELLLNAGSDPNVKDPITKETPLAYTFYKDDTNTVRLLLNFGADLHQPEVRKKMNANYNCKDYPKFCAIKDMFTTEIIRSIHIEKTDSAWYYADKKVNNIFGLLADSLVPFHPAGYSLIKMEKKWGVIDLFGKFTLSPIHEEIGSIEHPGIDKNALIIRTAYNGKWSIKFLNTKEYTSEIFDYISPFQYHNKHDKEEYAAVMWNGKYGLIDSKSKIVVQPIYDWIEKDDKGRTIGLIDGKKKKITW